MAVDGPLDKRQNRILDFVVRDYIQTREPVSSARIRRRLRLKESPATVRNLVASLSEDGYLEQPHTSAGRIPTDEAYRYFVDYLMVDVALAPSEIKRFEAVQDMNSEMIARFFSDALNLLSIASIRDADHDLFWQYGISYLLKEPEFHARGPVSDIGYILDHTDEMFNIYHQIRQSDTQLFIGKENPVSQAAGCGVFYLVRETPEQKERILLIGPRRMNYERALAFIHYFLERV